MSDSKLNYAAIARDRLACGCSRRESSLNDGHSGNRLPSPGSGEEPCGWTSNARALLPHRANEPLRQRALGEFWEMIKESVPILTHRYRSAPKADLRRLVAADVP